LFIATDTATGGSITTAAVATTVTMATAANTISVGMSRDHIPPYSHHVSTYGQ